MAQTFTGLTSDFTRLMGEMWKLQEANKIIAPWLSAALEDPNVCKEMKADVTAWFKAQE